MITSRPLAIAASRNGPVAHSIGRYLRSVARQHVLPHRVDLAPFQTATQLFQLLDAIAPTDLLTTVLVLDVGAEEGDVWDAAARKVESGLAARLVLSYPEIYFIFVNVAEASRPRYFHKQTDEFRRILTAHHFVPAGDLQRVPELLRRHADGFRTLFDATGLRSLLKAALMRLPALERARQFLPWSLARIDRPAIATDDESSYLYLNAYIAYRFFCRTWLLSTEAEFWRILPETAVDRVTGPARFAVVVADWQLIMSDADRPEGDGVLIEKADTSTDHRVVIVSGEYVAGGTSSGTLCNRSFKPKPYKGIFDPKSEIPGVLTVDQKRYESESVAELNPRKKQRHGLPYARAVVADRMLSRARQILGSFPGSVEACVQCALLSSEAKELVGGLSRTAYYEALFVQHEAEVLAEVSFLGVSSDIRATDRFTDLEQESQFFTKGASKEQLVSHQNSLARVAACMGSHFARYRQLKAAEESIEKMAGYQSILNKLDRGTPTFWNFAYQYLDVVTKYGTSLPRLMVCNAAWLAFFAVVYFVLLLFHPPQQTGLQEWIGLALGQSVLTFLELQPAIAEFDQEILRPHSTHCVFLYRFTIVAEIVVAYVQLGILISMLYRRLTRQPP